MIPSTDLDRWLQDARSGSAEALGRLLDSFRHYLLLVANREVDPALAAKVAPSDLVQDTFLKAAGGFNHFQGRTQEELQSWLRRILLNCLTSASRRYQGADKRQMSREITLPDTPTPDRQASFHDPGDSPSAQVAAQEWDEALKRALDQLPEQSRQIIQWRDYELLSFEEIGKRLGRTAEAARKLWTRALKHLKKLLEPGHEPS